MSSANSTSYQLYLLRHGELVQQDMLCGHADIRLSEKGWQQLEHTVSQLEASQLVSIEQCISSPLVRCVEFAQQFSRKKQCELIVDPCLKEMNFGDWDGVSYENLWQQAEHNTVSNIGLFWQNPWRVSPPNGETMSDFSLRVDAWWENFIATNPAKNTLVVTHAGVIKHLLARVLNMQIETSTHLSVFNIPYAGLIKLSIFIDEQGKSWPQILL